MIDTNQLLGVAFTLISNFTSVVEIPRDHVPQRKEDLAKFVVGSPVSPLDLYLVHHKGDEFWLRHGVVHQYQSPDSFFHRQDLSSRSRFFGPATVTSNQVMQRAIQTMQRLVKNGRPLDRVAAKMKSAWSPDVHYYEISWPVADSPFQNGLGAVEIDARNDRIVFIELWGQEFYDFAFAGEVSNRIYHPEPLSKPFVNPAAKMPKPTASQVQVLIPKWLEFCRQLGLDPGSQTNVIDMDPVETVVFKSANILEPGDLFKIQFRNGTVFESVNGKIFTHQSAKSAFAGAWAEKPAEHWEQFEGPRTKNWEDLAKNLNSLLVQQLGVAPSYFDKFTPTLFARGAGGVNRCLVRWCDAENPRKLPSYSHELKTILLVEFDLGTGDISTIRFQDRGLIGWQKQ